MPVVGSKASFEFQVWRIRQEQLLDPEYQVHGKV